MSVQKRLRALHRDVGLFVLLVTLVYAFSGSVLLFRDRDLLQVREVQTRQLEPGLGPMALMTKLKLKRMTLLREDEVQIEFRGGRYDKLSGIAEVGRDHYSGIMARMADLHTLRSSNPLAWFGAAYGVALAFLALSGLWMFPVRSRQFRRGLWLSGAGAVCVAVLLFVV